MSAGYAGYCGVSLYPTWKSVSDKKYIKVETSPAIPRIPRSCIDTTFTRESERSAGHATYVCICHAHVCTDQKPPARPLKAHGSFLVIPRCESERSRFSRRFEAPMAFLFNSMTYNTH